MRLRDRRVLVVGVGPGLGSAVAYFLLREGASVAIAARNTEKLDSIVARLAPYGRIVAVQGNAARPDDAARIVDSAFDRLGGLDHLVVSAGGYAETPIQALETPLLMSMLELNFLSHMYVVREALRRLGPGSAIVLVTSIGGAYAAWPRHVAYVSSKAATAKAVEVLAAELVDRGIRVNGVAPGGMSHDFEPGRDWRRYRKLGDPVAPPEDVARVIVWLLTDEAEWVNGAVIPVDGGRRLR